MVLRRGFGALKKVKREADKNRERMDAARAREFFLKKDGDSAKGWFNGPSDEPLLAMVHNLSINGGFTTDFCAAGVEDHEGCVYCYYQSKDKRISKPKPVGVFNFYDMTWVHKIPNAEKTAAAGGKFPKFDWLECRGDIDDEEPDTKACKLCRKGVERERAGQKRTRFSMTASGALDSQNDKLARKCLCGGRLTFDEYANGKKRIPREAFEDVDEPDDWEPVYECRKCDDPAPRTIHNCPVEITRSGTGTSTSYNFTPDTDSIGDPPDYVSAAELVELEASCAPRSAQLQAELLGAVNPFDPDAKKSSKKKASDYDAEDEDDDEEDPYDDDDDD